MNEPVTLWRIIIAYCMFLVTALCFGLTALRLLQSQLIRSERIVVGIILGASLLSPLVFLFAILHCAYGWLFCIIAALAAITLVVKRRWLLPSVAKEMEPVNREWMWFLISVLIGFGVFIYGKQAISPEHNPDSFTYHLGQVNLYANAHAMQLVMDIYSALPQGMEMLFLYVFPIGAHSAAALVHFTFLVCLPIMISFYGRRIGNYGAGVAAGVLVFAVPLIGMDGSAVYNDVALATVCFTALFLLQVGRTSSSVQELYAAAFLAGFAFSIKYTAAFFILFTGALLVYYLRRQPRVLVFALIALSFGPVLYLTRNAIVFHNPIAFFGNRLFPNPFFHISFEEIYVRNQANVNGIRWGLVPGELLRGGPKLDGSFGVVFILLPIALVGLLWPATRFLLLSAAVLALSYPANRAARFAIPFFPPLVLAFTMTLSWLCRSDLLLCTIAVAHLTLSYPAIFQKVFPKGGWHPDPPSWRVALRLDSAREYLSRVSEECKIAFQIDHAIEPGKRIFAFGGVGQAYMRQPLYISFQSAIAEEVADILFSTWNSEVQPRRQWTAHFHPTEVTAIRLVRRGKPEEFPWSISEVMPKLGDNEVPLENDWSTSAKPFTWSSRLAFDGNLLTRWRSWEPARPGMQWELCFGRPRMMDSIVVSDADSSEFTVQIETSAHRGQWLDLGIPKRDAVAARDLRKAAMQTILKRYGFQYVLFSDNDWNAAAFRHSASAWGICPVTSTRQYTLYDLSCSHANRK